MSNTICYDCDPNDDICEELRQQIHDLIYRQRGAGGGTKGLIHRFAEQIAPGASGPGTDSWNTHEQAMRDQQRGLRRRLDDWNRNGCGDPPPNAWSWATRPLPTPSEWRANNFDAGDAARYAAGGAAAVGAGYLIYRGIRMLPSLAPPLWWTIPGNLAVP